MILNVIAGDKVRFRVVSKVKEYNKTYWEKVAIRYQGQNCVC